VVNYLLDTSVITRLSHARPEVRDALQTLRAQGGVLARCAITDLEYGHSARYAAQWDALNATLEQFDAVDVDPTHFAIAKTLQRDLAATGLAGRKVPDLLIAAVAIHTGLTLTHYDHDFGHIARVSTLTHHWIMPPGTID
jgi:predicted nucleic acid-binding protein